MFPESDDLNATLAAPARTMTATAPASYVQPTYTERCQKCAGSGRFGRFGRCFKCNGTGRQTFKTPTATRAANRERAATRSANREQEYSDAFAAANPAIAAWIEAERAGFEFAQAMHDAVRKYGDLTEKQMAACQRAVDRKAASTAARAERAAAAPVVATEGIDRLKAAFDAAARYTAERARGLTVRNPKINIGGMVISPAKATSANPGALYVKATADRTYLGKIADGRFHASRDCTAEQQAQVLSFIADPAEAAKVYGQETGICCVCNATLRSEWRLRGIGPICAEKFGW